MRTPELDGVYTKVVGVTSGPDAKMRQAALRRLKNLSEEARPRLVRLVPDPDNPVDPHAVKVMVDIPELGEVQLGFVRNREARCNRCHLYFPIVPENGCPSCKKTDSLERVGLATEICRAMARDPSLSFYGEIMEITGGKAGQSLGCNIRIRSLSRPRRQEP